MGNGFPDDILNREKITNAEIMVMNKEREYPYYEHNVSGTNPEILRSLESEDGVHFSDYQAMKVFAIQSSSRYGNKETDRDRSIKITEFRLNNYLTVQLWLRASQVRKFEKPFRDLNTKNRDTFVTTFEQEKYQLGFRMIPVT